MYFSHSRNGSGQDGESQPVYLHLRRVAKLAKSFGDGFGVGTQAEATASLHDLGKYSRQFQRRLTNRAEPSRDHWSLGAAAALRNRRAIQLIPAAAILGHHVGLNSIAAVAYVIGTINKTLQSGESTTPDSESQQAALQAFREDGFALPRIDRGLSPMLHRAADMLDTRMLFSTLVDADFLATEGHFEGDAQTPYRPRSPGQLLRAERMRERWLDELESLEKTSDGDQGLLALRTRLMSDCAAAGASQPTGAFTLTAPTGTGKTLAMLRFAIEHAVKHSMRRIVLVMPFINIVQQTASIYRELFPQNLFGEGYVLESHSLAGRDSDVADHDGVNASELRRRLLSQNWDAPVVLTTNVGLLESLHAHRPSQCRKLHRLAGIHLSTSLCALHRSEKLATVRERLDRGRPIWLVSTQCIEAGVDVDFPTLYRAFAPLDCIAQAAGRCNRNGRLPASEVVVFQLDDPDHRTDYPPGYGEGIGATKVFLQNLRQTSPDALPGVLSDPQRLRSYFRQLYSVTGRDSGQVGGERELHKAVLATDFATVAQHYRLINQDVVNVLVPYQLDAYEKLRAEATQTQRMSPRAIRRWQAMAGPHAVSVYRSTLDKDASHLLPIAFGRADHELSTDHIDWWYPRDQSSYTDRFGLRFEDEEWVV